MRQSVIVTERTTQETHLFHETSDGPLYLDLTMNPDVTDAPLIVYLFGGAWMAGDRHQVNTSLLPSLVSQGYAIASLDYRHSQVAVFPAQISDLKSGIGWLRTNAGNLGFDPGRIGVFGPSAGGHLAALLGTTSGTDHFLPEGYRVADCAVQAVVDLFGPTDFLQMDAQSLSDQIIHDSPDSPESRLVGGAIVDHEVAVRAANPITYIDGSEPPFLVVHGDQDPLVPHHQSELLASALDEAGSVCTFVTVEGGGHGSGGTFNSDEFAADVLNFLDVYLKGGSHRDHAAT